MPAPLELLRFPTLRQYTLSAHQAFHQCRRTSLLVEAFYFLQKRHDFCFLSIWTLVLGPIADISSSVIAASVSPLVMMISNGRLRSSALIRIWSSSGADLSLSRLAKLRPRNSVSRPPIVPLALIISIT